MGKVTLPLPRREVGMLILSDFKVGVYRKDSNGGICGKGRRKEVEKLLNEV